MPKYRLAFREQDLGMLYKIKPLTDQSQITIFFQIPDYDLDSRYKFAPNDYFTSLIGHEGESKGDSNVGDNVILVIFWWSPI